MEDTQYEQILPRKAIRSCEIGYVKVGVTKREPRAAVISISTDILEILQWGDNKRIEVFYDAGSGTFMLKESSDKKKSFKLTRESRKGGYSKIQCGTNLESMKTKKVSYLIDNYSTLLVRYREEV